MSARNPKVVYSVPIGTFAMNVTPDEFQNGNVDDLARQLLLEQKETLGFEVAYCGCGSPVSRATAWRARKEGRAARCRPCADAVRPKMRSSDKTVYLCSVCRTALVGSLANQARQT